MICETIKLKSLAVFRHHWRHELWDWFRGKRAINTTRSTLRSIQFGMNSRSIIRPIITDEQRKQKKIIMQLVILRVQVQCTSWSRRLFSYVVSKPGPTWTAYDVMPSAMTPSRLTTQLKKFTLTPQVRFWFNMALMMQKRY